MRKLLICSLVILAACRGEELIVPETEIPVGGATTGQVVGMYLLNESAMGRNKCTLDYFDYTTGVYHLNIYPQRNPGIVKELGDVGNDLGIYGSKLYAVINRSNLVEVMDVRTARHLGSFEIPNCRYITFHGGKAYVSSYAGPIQIDPAARPGYVAEIDTATLTVGRKVTVGYQPEEMAVVNNKLYVANSGGYRTPNYDRTVSVVDLKSFTEIKKIDVEINLHRLKADSRGNLFVTSRGDNQGKPSNLFMIDTQRDEVEARLDIPATNLAIAGDSIYLISFDDLTRETGYAIVNIPERKIVSRNFLADGYEKKISVPYGIAVNPENRDIFITDAKNYMDPGTLYRFSKAGKYIWETVTGDLPAHMVFSVDPMTPGQTLPDDTIPGDDDKGKSPYITRVLDFRPAPGQFVNVQPAYSQGDTQEAMNRKVLDLIGNNKGRIVSLGGFGGYVVVGFDHTIRNVDQEKDFRVLGNAFTNETGRSGGSSEPGIVMVAYDRNKNGVPDPDEWYELAGSEYDKAETLRNYEIRYFKPDEEKEKVKDPNDPTITDAEYIRWSDNQGTGGFMPRVTFHAQPYYPQWIPEDELVFRGTRLAPNAVNIGSGNVQNWVFSPYDWGYADNFSDDDDRSCFDIGWAVDQNGKAVRLPGADFIKIYTGVNQTCGWTGEVSTEVCGVTDLHIK